MMKLYDSLTNKNFEIKNQKTISIYNCGPTVYNHVHIGNVRPLIIFDVLYRLLKYLGYDVKYFHNITDIDDKIIKKALEYNKTESEIADKYYQAYLNVMKELNVLKMAMPRVSENITKIITYIQKLIDTKHAYATKEGNVYFDINSTNLYGKLSKQQIVELKESVRKQNLEDKHFALDFNLWKKTNQGMAWNSPWSKGRPGWHTECACLINQYIGDHVTIHGGGIDLKFPHHENENIQNIALNGRNLADCWMHIGHINVNHQKMAKSSNNFILVKDILKSFDANTLRWFMYKTKYENPQDYSLEVMQETKNDLQKLFRQINSIFVYLYINNQEDEINQQSNKEFLEVLCNDLDLPNALKIIYVLAKDSSSLIKSKQTKEILKTINELLFCLNFIGIKYLSPLNNQNKSLIDNWQLALKNKDFEKADQIRNQLQSLGLM